MKRCTENTAVSVNIGGETAWAASIDSAGTSVHRHGHPDAHDQTHACKNIIQVFAHQKVTRAYMSFPLEMPRLRAAPGWQLLISPRLPRDGYQRSDARSSQCGRLAGWSDAPNPSSTQRRRGTKDKVEHKKLAFNPARCTQLHLRLPLIGAFRNLAAALLNPSPETTMTPSPSPSLSHSLQQPVALQLQQSPRPAPVHRYSSTQVQEDSRRASAGFLTVPSKNGCQSADHAQEDFAFATLPFSVRVLVQLGPLARDSLTSRVLGGSLTPGCCGQGQVALGPGQYLPIRRWCQMRLSGLDKRRAWGRFGRKPSD